MFGFGRNNISVKDAVSKKEDAVFLDVRTPEEYVGGHIPKCTNINFYDSAFAEHINKLDKTKEYIVYCQSGGRSSKATRLMKAEGFQNVCNLEGGISAWQREGNRVEE